MSAFSLRDTILSERMCNYDFCRKIDPCFLLCRSQDAAAALFASIAQVFIARSSNLYAYRLESDKLFFHAKVEAYQQFFQATDRCMNLLDRTSAGDLLARCSYAILFSEEDATCKKLSALSALLMEFRSSPASTNVLEKLKVAEYEAVEAMRQELLQLREPRHQPLTKHKHRV